MGKGGAFTGEVSAEMLHDFGIPWVILGHSGEQELSRSCCCAVSGWAGAVLASPRLIPVTWCCESSAAAAGSQQLLVLCLLLPAAAPTQRSRLAVWERRAPQPLPDCFAR